ncbi:MAG TPA: DUF488 domain-containing protein [Ktedonobacterales bacterium]
MPDEEPQSLVVYTIGHSNVALEALLALLARHEISLLADVRSAPYSRYVPHFNRPSLEVAARQAGIGYRFMGDTLGGRPQGDEYYDAERHVFYSRVARADWFQRGIAQLRELAGRERVVVLCGEEDPAGCHRRLLVGRVLAREGALLRHIRGDGHIEEERAVAIDVPPPSLWDDPSEAAAREREEQAWRSIRPVSRTPAPSDSSSGSATPASGD